MTGDGSRCYRGADGGRVTIGRHLAECAEPETCRGCRPCPTRHCADCRQVHVEAAVVCDTCLGQVRASLTTIVALYGDLLGEAMCGQQATRELPGGDATVALGPWSSGLGSPTGDRWAEWRAYSEANRVDSDWHPVLTLESWGEMWREWTGQPEPVTEATLTSAVGFLGRSLSAINTAGPRDDEHPPDFTELAADIGQTRARLENVLHDGERRQSGSPCLRCNAALIRVTDAAGRLTDDWSCPKCQRTYDAVQYANAVAAGYVAVQIEVLVDPLGQRHTWGTVARAAIETRRSERTIRTWMRDGRVRQACLVAGRRRVVSVDDARREDTDRSRRYRSEAKGA